MSGPTIPSPAARPSVRLPLRRRRSWAWVRLLRPVALIAAVLTTLAFLLILTDGHPAWHHLLRLLPAMAAVIAFASLLNDALDAPRDRDTYVWRPIPAGLVTPRQALRAAAVCAVVALALGGSLGWRPFLLTAAGLAAVLAYDLRLRSTPLSWLPLALGFALVPAWVAESVDRFDNVLWWALPVGFVGGSAAHVLLKLPDYERDDAPGSRNVLHWLTIDYAIPAGWGLFGAYLVLATAAANVEGPRLEWLAPPALLGLFLALGLVVALSLRVTERRLAVQRGLLLFAILGMAIGWLGSIVP